MSESENTEASKQEDRQHLHDTAERMTTTKDGRKQYPKVTHRPDLADTYGYDSKGKYIGKPWNQCY